MNKDFRVTITMADHPKTIKLMRRLGDRSFWCLVKLWSFTAANKPDGVLTGLDAEDIEIASRWEGESGKFVDELVSLGWLNESDGVFSLHDWVEHNEYATHAKARSEKAKKAAQKRWSKANAENEHMPIDAPSNAKTCSEQCPSPSPSPNPSPNPNPEEKDICATPEADVTPATVSPAKPPCPHQAIAEAYNRILPQLPAVQKLTEKRQKQLRSLWGKSAERQDLGWWENYFQTVAESPFLIGEGGNEWFAGFDWLLKPANMTKVLEGQYRQKPGRRSSATKQVSTFNATRTLDLPADCPFEYANLDEVEDYAAAN
jgi:hypothetical protein